MWSCLLPQQPNKLPVVAVRTGKVSLVLPVTLEPFCPLFLLLLLNVLTLGTAGGVEEALWGCGGGVESKYLFHVHETRCHGNIMLNETSGFSGKFLTHG